MGRAHENTVKTVIADDHDLIRVGVRELLAGLATIEIVAEATNGIETIGLVKQHQPDLLIVDIAMPYSNGIEVIEETRRWSSRTRCIVLTGMTSVALLQQAIHVGAAGVFFKSGDTDEFADAIPRILAGETVHAQRLDAALEAHSRFSTLTPREVEVLQALVRGESLIRVAGRLCISRNTADKHRAAIMRKLSVHSTSELMVLAYREGLLEAADTS